MKRNGSYQHTRKQKPVLITYKNKTFDVSKSELWQNGVHMGRHRAGEDLTDALAEAPHGEEVLERFDEDWVSEAEHQDLHRNNKEDLRDLYRKYHPHPVFAHLPIGSFLLGGFLQLLFLISKDNSFEYAAFYSLVFATITNVPVVASGVFSWWINYQLTLTPIFRRKLIYSLILCLISCAIVIMRLHVAEISSAGNMLGFIYNALIFASVPIVFIIGFIGGKITWAG